MVGPTETPPVGSGETLAEESSGTPGSQLGRRQIHAVAGCYFVASFAALGLPPYLTQILPELGDPTARWAGLLYIVPTVFGGLGAPLWGRLADRFGRKRLLLRAQLGLAVSFLLAGWADSLPAFTAALVLQGVLGGTFAASNGYLGAALKGPALSKALTLMQGSARAALVLAPIVVGSLSPWLSPHRQYALLAVLPLAAALMLAALPEPRADETAGRAAEAEAAAEREPDGSESAGSAAGSESAPSEPGTVEPGRIVPGRADSARARPGHTQPVHAQPARTGLGRAEPGAAEHRTAEPAPGPLRALYAFEFAFVFSTVISFPYLISLVEKRIPGASPVLSGLLFALPHLCYLVGAMAVHAAFRDRPRSGIALGFGGIALGLAGHTLAGSPAGFVAVRLLLGAGLTLGLVCLSVLAADCAKGRAPGGMFGSLEFASKAGAVAAGLAAAAGNSWFGPTAPLLIGTAVAVITVPATVLPTLIHRYPHLRWSR